MAVIGIDIDKIILCGTWGLKDIDKIPYDIQGIFPLFFYLPRLYFSLPHHSFWTLVLLYKGIGHIPYVSLLEFAKS